MSAADILAVASTQTATFRPQEDESEWSTVRQILENAENSSPRSLQWEIGPSEMGTTCLHCLAARLAGWERTQEAPLAPWIGTAVHAQHEHLFAYLPGDRWEPEYPVHTCDLTMPDGQIMHVGGHIDLWDTQTATTLDWKFVGESVYRAARRGEVSQEYRIQASLYGIGLANENHAPKTSEIIYFNRATGRTFDDVCALSWPFEREPGEWAIDRCQDILSIFVLLERDGGHDERDAWIRSLPRASFCFSCKDYPDAELRGMRVPWDKQVPQWAIDQADKLEATYHG